MDVFKRHYGCKELIELLRITQNHLNKFTNERGAKQTIEIVLRGLSKKLYFNPVGRRTGVALKRRTTSPTKEYPQSS